ncbi:TetR/AcrR family transcriptional regulator [Nocardia brasiliensis]|uniref:TetR/AcrR family transcriptional regulator n=1 Tax=Nocardia brasiliensis TaxID=37326 RepID=UPI002457DD46|nr:TetR/AcrR family transcriptional regulator [Nocardia brasiliensis]
MTEPDSATPRRRPGGRSARVRESVHRAVLEALIEHGVERVGIPDVARRAAVRDSSIYRRWGTRENLIVEALLAYSEETLPPPDTGTLHGDLTAFAIELADYLATPLGGALARSMALISDSPEIEAARNTFWANRFSKIRPVITRAVDRGELPAGTDARQALELLIAPLHFRALLTRTPTTPVDADQLATLVTRALQTPDR